MESTEKLKQSTKPIPERSGLTYEEFAEEYLYPMQPVILTDGLEGWAAIGKWSPKYFSDRYSDKPVTIDGEKYLFSEFLKLVENSGNGNVAPYFRNREVREEFSELMADLSPTPCYILPNWLRGPFYPSAGREAEIYIGGAGGGFPFLHYDSNSTHAFLGQVYGEKEAILYSPEQTELVYAKTDSLSRHHSYITDIENTDLNKFPLFAEATAYRGILKPGYLLFIPSRWWHTARMLSPSITISYNVANASNWANVKDEICYKTSNKMNMLKLPMFIYMSLLGFFQRFFD